MVRSYAKLSGSSSEQNSHGVLIEHMSGGGDRQMPDICAFAAEIGSHEHKEYVRCCEMNDQDYIKSPFSSDRFGAPQFDIASDSDMLSLNVIQVVYPADRPY